MQSVSITYVVTKEESDYLQDAVYIQQDLHAMFISAHLHNEFTLVFDVELGFWTCSQ